jgi:hypothetical protein
MGRKVVCDMRKIRFVVLALFAVFAFGALLATSAFAESKILFKNANIETKLAFEVTGALLLEDMAATGTPDILCNGSFDGLIEPGGTLAYVEEVLTEGKELLAGETGGNGKVNDLIECTEDKAVCSNPVDIEASELPWHIEVQLDLSESLEIYLAHFLSLAEIEELLEVGIGVPTWIVDCNSILGLVLDVCSGLSSARLFNSATGELLGSFNELSDSEKDGAETEKANCTVGGLEQGLIVSVTLGGEEDTEAAAGVFKDPEEAGIFSVSP